MDELETTLGVEKDTDKTFYCNFDIFKNIYQLNLRSVRRSQGKYYLLLFSLLPKNDTLPDSVKMKRIMNLLYDLLANGLRKNDVFTRASLNQYSVLLNVSEDININTVTDRIIKAFEEINPDPDIYLNIEEKPIE